MRLWELMDMGENEDGERILEICQSRKLKIVKTMLGKQDKNKINYRNGKKRCKLITSWQKKVLKNIVKMLQGYSRRRLFNTM